MRGSGDGPLSGSYFLRLNSLGSIDLWISETFGSETPLCISESERSKGCIVTSLFNKDQ